MERTREGGKRERGRERQRERADRGHEIYHDINISRIQITLTNCNILHNTDRWTDIEMRECEGDTEGSLVRERERERERDRERKREREKREREAEREKERETERQRERQREGGGRVHGNLTGI